MVKKVCAIAVVFLFGVELMAAGFQFNLSGGYSFGAGRDYVGSINELDNNGDYTKYRDIYASMGSGIKLDVDFAVLLHNNFGIILGTGFSMLGGYKTESKTPISSIERTMYGNYIPVIAGLKFHAGNGNVLPYLHIAPGIFIPIGVHGESVTNDTSVSEISRKYTPGFCISSGIGLLFKISNAVGLKVECAPFYGFARLKEEHTKRSDGSEITYIYLKNDKDLPSSTTDTIYSHGGPTFSFSSIGAKVGVVLSF